MYKVRQLRPVTFEEVELTLLGSRQTPIARRAEIALSIGQLYSHITSVRLDEQNLAASRSANTRLDFSLYGSFLLLQRVSDLLSIVRLCDHVRVQILVAHYSVQLLSPSPLAVADSED